MEPIGCPETSVRNYHYTLRNNPEERSFHLLRRGNLKTRGKISPPHVGSRIIRLTTPCPRNEVRGSGRCEKDSSQQSGRLSETMLVAILLHRQLSRRGFSLLLSVFLCLNKYLPPLLQGSPPPALTDEHVSEKRSLSEY